MKEREHILLIFPKLIEVRPLRFVFLGDPLLRMYFFSNSKNRNYIQILIKIPLNIEFHIFTIKSDSVLLIYEGQYRIVVHPFTLLLLIFRIFFNLSTSQLLESPCSSLSYIIASCTHSPLLVYWITVHTNQLCMTICLHRYMKISVCMHMFSYQILEIHKKVKTLRQ